MRYYNAALNEIVFNESRNFVEWKIQFLERPTLISGKF